MTKLAFQKLDRDLIAESYLQLIMNIPFTALYFASYETAKRATMKHANCEESLLIQGLAGTPHLYIQFRFATYMDTSAGTKPLT